MLVETNTNGYINNVVATNLFTQSKCLVISNVIHQIQYKAAALPSSPSGNFKKMLASSAGFVWWWTFRNVIMTVDDNLPSWQGDGPGTCLRLACHSSCVRPLEHSDDKSKRARRVCAGYNVRLFPPLLTSTHSDFESSSAFGVRRRVVYAARQSFSTGTRSWASVRGIPVHVCRW